MVKDLADRCISDAFALAKVKGVKRRAVVSQSLDGCGTHAVRIRVRVKMSRTTVRDLAVALEHELLQLLAVLGDGLEADGGHVLEHPHGQTLQVRRRLRERHDAVV